MPCEDAPCCGCCGVERVSYEPEDFEEVEFFEREDRDDRDDDDLEARGLDEFDDELADDGRYDPEDSWLDSSYEE
jgi:hypothetical protein